MDNQQRIREKERHTPMWIASVEIVLQKWGFPIPSIHLHSAPREMPKNVRPSVPPPVPSPISATLAHAPTPLRDSIHPTSKKC
jgi:hypothetical protein